ncbi:hypothetical protein HYX13_03445 [Candidatus Woesearchaeota archaeon]|nr:hypothetical protein [Candidatus Woesearchaeota archaeon]
MKKRGVAAVALRVGVMFTLFLMLFFTPVSFFSTSVLADTNTLIPCLSNADCQDLNGGSYYCNADTQTCYLLSEETPAKTSSSSSTIEERVVDLEMKIDTLEDTVTKTSSALNLLTNEVQHLNRQLEKLFQAMKISTPETPTKEGTSSEKETAKSLSAAKSPSESKSSKKTIAGQAVAGEQGELQEVTSSEEGVSGISSTTIFIFFLIVLVAGVTAVIVIVKKKPSIQIQLQKEEKEVVAYITAHLKAGKKFFHIKESLQKTGWGEMDIRRLYKIAVQNNYQKYKEKKGEQKVSQKESQKQLPRQQSASDKQRIMLISLVVLLLIGGIFLFLREIVGQAISTEQLVGGKVGGEAGEVTYNVQCTPPQIPTPEGDTCCTDANQDTVCDITEKEVEKVTEKCTDNLQCPAGEYCIDGTCGLLSSVYHGSSNCEKMCNYYSLKISTSDGEAYTVKPGRGSYTAVGALQWDVLKGVPSHCEGERARVPLLISKREPGKITDEYVITLRQGETSEPMTHRLVPGLNFALTMGQIYELCE